MTRWAPGGGINFHDFWALLLRGESDLELTQQPGRLHRAQKAEDEIVNGGPDPPSVCPLSDADPWLDGDAEVFETVVQAKTVPIVVKGAL